MNTQPSKDAEANAPQTGSSPSTENEDVDEGWSSAPTETLPVASQASHPSTSSADSLIPSIQARREEVRACYDRVVLTLESGRKKFSGDVVVQIVVYPSGGVKRAEYLENESTLGSNPEAAARVGSCAADVIRGWQFSPSERGREREVRYPFNFHYRGGGNAP